MSADQIYALIKNIEWSDKTTREAIHNTMLAIEDKLKLHCQKVATILKNFVYIKSDIEPSYADILLKCGNKYYTVHVELDHDIHVKVINVEEEK